MYLTHLNAALAAAFKGLLSPRYNPHHPVLRGKELWVGSEYPAVEANYPGVWINYTPGDLRRSGLGHVEYRVEQDIRRGTRWSFDGLVSLTVVSLSRMERDELIDEVVRLFAFSDEHPELEGLRQSLVSNEFISMNAASETLSMNGLTASGGTPWGSDEVVFEGTVSFTVEGTFVSDRTPYMTLVPISDIIVVAEMDPALPDPKAPPVPDDGWQ